MNFKKHTKVLKFCAFVFFCCCVGYIYVTECLKSHAGWEDETFTKHCNDLHGSLKKLENLSQTVHDALEEAKISHFLMYGSIWGVLRGFKGPLPWDFDVDFGTILTDSTSCNIAKVTESLEKKGIAHFNFMKDSGLVKFFYANEEKEPGRKTIDLFFYQPTQFGFVRRVGYEVWLFALHYYVHHTFPYRLVEGELEAVEFAGRRIKIPRDGIEIMKYLYRYNWWTTRTPKNYNCTNMLKGGR